MAYRVTQYTISSRHSLFFRYHEPSSYTSKRNFIYTHKTEVCLMPIFTTPMSDKHNYVQISNIEL